MLTRSRPTCWLQERCRLLSSQQLWNWALLVSSEAANGEHGLITQMTRNPDLRQDESLLHFVRHIIRKRLIDCHIFSEQIGSCQRPSWFKSWPFANIVIISECFSSHHVLGHIDKVGNWIQRQAGRYFAHGCLSGKKIIGGRQKTRQDIHTHQKTRRPGSGQVLIILDNKQVVRTCGLHQMFALQSKTRCRHFFSTSAIFRLSGSHQFQSERWLLLKRSQRWDKNKSRFLCRSVSQCKNMEMLSNLHLKCFQLNSVEIPSCSPICTPKDGSVGVMCSAFGIHFGSKSRDRRSVLQSQASS